MKAQNYWPEDRANLPCRKYPALCIVLFIFMLAPAIAAEIILGRLLTHLILRPGFLAVLCVAPGMIALLIFGMLVGGIIWLLAMKPFVKRDVLAELFSAARASPFFPRFVRRSLIGLMGGARPEPNYERWL